MVRPKQLPFVALYACMRVLKYVLFLGVVCICVYICLMLGGHARSYWCTRVGHVVCMVCLHVLRGNNNTIITQHMCWHIRVKAYISA